MGAPGGRNSTTEAGGCCRARCVDGEHCSLAAMSGRGGGGDGAWLGHKGPRMLVREGTCWGSEPFRLIQQAECRSWASQHRDVTAGSRTPVVGVWPLRDILAAGVWKEGAKVVMREVLVIFIVDASLKVS